MEYYKDLLDDKDNIFRLIDSGVFNEIIMAYAYIAMKNSSLKDNEKRDLCDDLYYVFDEMPSKKVFEHYKGNNK